MRRYETLIIFPDTLEEEAAGGVFDDVKQILTDQGGRIVDENWWGKRKFAYEINRRSYGYYAVLDYEASLDGRQELERRMKLNDDILRFKTVRPELRVRRPA